MGKYLETKSVRDKINDLVNDYGAVPIGTPQRPLWKMFGQYGPDDQTKYAMVCVVDNGRFHAAAWIYDQREFDGFLKLDDGRKKSWLLVGKDVAAELAGVPAKEVGEYGRINGK